MLLKNEQNLTTSVNRIFQTMAIKSRQYYVLWVIHFEGLRPFYYQHMVTMKVK